MEDLIAFLNIRFFRFAVKKSAKEFTKVKKEVHYVDS